MTAGAPWSVKGIDPKAREVAKDLARRSGLTLGEWLNRVILEDDTPEEVTAEAQLADRPRRISHEPPRLRAVPSAAGGDLSRVAHALDRLTDRIESSETRTGLAISGVEHSVRQALARIETAEREQIAVAARVDQSGGEQARMAERLKRLEAEASGPRSAEAIRMLEDRIARSEAVAGGDPEVVVEAVLQRLGERLAGAEARTAQALDGLARTLAVLERRLGDVERGGADGRFEALARRLTEQVEAARAEVAEKLKASAAGQVEARLAEMSAHVAASERRSAQAVERMGREVLAMAEALNRRLGSAEQRSAEAIEQVGGEIARIAGAVEARLSRAEQAQAEALERLGVEIGRITDRLSERLMNSERRAAQAIDDVGEQVARVTERIEQRHDRAATDLSERIRQSEERTQRMLDEARRKLGLPGQAPAAAELQAGAEPRGPFGPELFSRAEPDLDTPPPAAERPAFTSEDFEAAEAFAPIPEPEGDIFDLDDEPLVAEVEDETGEEARPLSTREVIDQARAAARAAQGARARPVEVRAKLDRRAASGRLFNGFGVGAKPRRGASPLQTALMVAGGAAFLSVGAAGVVLMEGPKPEAGDAARPFGDNPRAAAVIAPQPEPPAAPELAPPQAPADPAEAAFTEAVRAVEAGKPGGLSALKAIADRGYAPAQFYLAQLYETGRAGVAANVAEARRWTARAAEGGEPNAMHNLGLYYFRGEGGPQDLASAAQWFRKAASLGVVDSQYNLGLMYQSGSGVQRDLAEAYKWFSLAAAQGDGLARAGADALKPQLPPAATKQVEAAVAAAKAAAEPAALSVPDAKRILGRLGYYDGPVDAAADGAFKTALAEYQKDQGAPATGALDPRTASLLSVYRR